MTIMSDHQDSQDQEERRFPELPEHEGNGCLLTGSKLNIATVARVARKFDVRITLSADAERALQESFDLVLAAAAHGKRIYGLTVGVGWNKDRSVFENADGEPQLSDTLLDRSRRFNLSSLRAHGAGIGKPMPVDVVRAGMVVRLNQLLSGQSGVQPRLAHLYRDFLNHGITPVVPSRGSVGAGDITLASHIGLAMVGEGDVFFDRRRMPATEAMQACGIAPLQPIGKDFLSIISTNSLTAGHAALLADEASRFLRRQTVVFGLTLEGFNGNLAPFLPEVTRARPFPGVLKGADAICEVLRGSYLWQRCETRALQDPLSYRTMGYTLGNALEALDDLESALTIQINHSDDNPSVQLGDFTGRDNPLLDGYLVEAQISGAILPTSNFEMLPVASRVERLNQALVRLAQAMTTQTVLFEDPDMTGLPRFLSSGKDTGHAFGAVQKLLVSLFTESAQLGAQPPHDAFAMAGSIEDVSGHGPLSVANLDRLLDNLYWMASIQLLHAAQAIDLRRPSQLAEATGQLMRAYREVVPFVAADRVYSPDFTAGYEFLSGRKFDDSIDLNLSWN